MTGHHHAKKEIQKIGVYVTETQRDTIRIKVENMDSGTYRLLFKNSWKTEGVASGSCSSMSSASALDSCLWYYMAWFCGGNDVNATFYDSSGNEVSSPVLGGTGIYDMTSGNLMNGQCTTGITLIPETTASSVTIQNSDEINI
jgi:hypothetical protein